MKDQPVPDVKEEEKLRIKLYAVLALARGLQVGQQMLEPGHIGYSEAYEAVKNLRHALEKAAAFKDFVHRRLDTAGVPKEFPDGEHTKEGCRIGDRLDWVLEKKAAVAESVDAPDSGEPGAVSGPRYVQGRIEHTKGPITKFGIASSFRPSVITEQPAAKSLEEPGAAI